MAARSPVIIESSPDQAYPAPSITPDNARPSGNTASTSRSSPQLLSPSAFTRPRAQLLKSGSKAQQVPAGAHAGFASAASIWKVQAIEEQAKSAVEDETRSAGGMEWRVERTSRRRRPLANSQGRRKHQCRGKSQQLRVKAPRVQSLTVSLSQRQIQ